MKKIFLHSGIFVSVFVFIFFTNNQAQASYHFSNYKGRPPIHILGGASKTPNGMTPSQIKSFYNLPSSGGHGTIVIVGAYDDQNIEKDLKDGKDILVVASHNSLRAIVKYVENVSDEKISGIELPFGALVKYEFNGEEYKKVA